jgi:hypothetical protein
VAARQLVSAGTGVDVPMQNLRKLLAGSCGKVIIARPLTDAEVNVFERERGDSDAGGL